MADQTFTARPVLSVTRTACRRTSPGGGRVRNLNDREKC